MAHPGLNLRSALTSFANHKIHVELVTGKSIEGTLVAVGDEGISVQTGKERATLIRVGAIVSVEEA